MERSQQIALVGNPNAGKSSLFNQLTGLNQKVGNFSGVTVDKKVGAWKVASAKYQLIDLPGLYSLNPKSIDEKISVDVLLGNEASFKADKLVVVVDASNLKRSLFLQPK